MDSHVQTAPLLICPSYSNSVVWSEENLVAVACGSIITILNPAVIDGPRGLIKLTTNKPFSVGVVKEDISTPSLMAISLSRDTRPCARSISWSPMGFAPNSGCFLAICTIDGNVRIYRSPYCEYCVEWVEVMDISEMLLDYLVKTNFGEQNVSSGNFNQEETNKDHTLKEDHVIDSPNSIPVNGLKRKRPKALARMKERCLKTAMENGVPLITASQYASRSAMLSSLIVAWSPILELTSGSSPSYKYALLAVGSKSGKISFWRFRQPECYTIEPGRVSIDAILIGLLQAHNAWVTAISWQILTTNSSKSHLVLATGSSDGSVRLWIVGGDDLITSSEVNFTSFQLSKEMVTVTYIPISTLSMAVPISSPDRIILAVGKGSGSLEAWICHISSSKFQSVRIYNGHDQMVTGLCWAFDGCCLYSCSQDSSIRSWDLCTDPLDGSVSKPAILQESRNVAQLSDPCLGLALSPGNLMIAVIRSFDIDLLNPMYQARTQKAAVEFFWTGDQLVNSISNLQLDSSSNMNGLSGVPERDLSCWKSNILWSLKQYHNVEKPLVLWDILAALLAFKEIAPSFVEDLLLEWLSSWNLDLSSDMSTEKILFHVQSSLPKVSMRQIHLLNMICRRLVLPEMKTVAPKDGTIYCSEDKRNLWNDLLIQSEKELRVRLVTFSFRAILFLSSHLAVAASSSTNWLPVGVTQMKQWVAINRMLVEDQILLLASRINELGSRIKSICENEVEESCGFCSASVPFESPEVAFCKSAMSADHSVRHKLGRCAVSMKLCPVTNLLWFCMCCQRWTTKHMPSAFFSMYDSSTDVGYAIESLSSFDCMKPLCPFCGILLQRYAPNFLLSANPV